MSSIAVTQSRAQISDALAAQIVGNTVRPRRLAKALVIALIASIFALLFVPWQQTVTGKGRVVARSPLDRQQAIAAPVSGRIVDWYGHREGSRVKRGERILKITDNDPEYLTRLEASVAQAKLKLTAAKAKVESYDFHVRELKSYRDFTVTAATQILEAAKAKVRAAEQAREIAEASVKTAKINVERKKKLYEQGIDSARTYELADLELRKSETDLEKAMADLAAALNEVSAKAAQRDSYQSEADAKVAKAEAERNEAIGDVAIAEKELLNSETTLARQATQDVVAPCDGTILRLQAAQAGDIVKAGDPLFLVVPDSWDKAVEIWVDGNDATLIEPGRSVRLVFEGFPGIQFMGWPSVAIGTFGGTVDLVDVTDNGNGEFRILVVPDENDEWPDARYLRQGVRANGWVLLNRVTLGFELWRQLNGFPPVVAKEPPSDKDIKRPKAK